MSKPLLQVHQLSLGFSTKDHLKGKVNIVDALTDISFELHAGETLALLGESGCGKSLTALALMRLLPQQTIYQSGKVVLSQEFHTKRAENLLCVSEDRMREIRGRRMAMIFQEPSTSLNPVMRIGEQIIEVLRLHTDLSSEACLKEALNLLGQVGMPDPQRVITAYPFELSGGMKQRAMIAMALAGNPNVLLADEPTTALDVTLQAQILDLINDLKKQRDMGVLLITHDLAVVSARADRVAVMYAGQIVESGPVKEVLGRPSHPYTRALLAALPEKAKRGQSLAQIPGRVPLLGSWPLACRFEPRCGFKEPHCLVESPPWVAVPGAECEQNKHHALCWRVADESIETNEQAACIEYPTDVSNASPILQVTDLSVNYRPVRSELLVKTLRAFGRQPELNAPTVDAVSFDLLPGETLALVGESGCGKTTVARAILRLIESQCGQVTLQGQPIVGRDITPFKEWRRMIQMVFQDPFASLDPRQRVREILSEGPRSLGLERITYENQALVQLLDRVGLPAQALDRYPHEFSGGQRQRIAIARALAVSPKVLICDEPTSALDVSVQAQILNLLRKLQDELGIAYLFITHNFGVVRYLADRVVVMQSGKVVETGRTEALLANPQHEYTRKLLASVPVLLVP